MKKIFDYIKQQKNKNKKKSPKIGIYTQLNIIKQYVQKLKKFIEPLEEKLPSKQGKTLIIQRIKYPIGPSAQQILKSMRFAEEEFFIQNQENVQQNYENQAMNSLILPVYIFTDFQESIAKQKQFIFDKFFQDQIKQRNRIAFLKNVTHVHHKAIFDCLNQMLDYQRPFGIWGIPFPWKLKFSKTPQITEINLKKSLKNACDKVIESAMYICGLLVDKEQSLVKNTPVSQAYIQEVKQDRMSKMIINDFLQNEVRFYFLDDEQAQVLLETAYIVWVMLIQQATTDLAFIANRNLDKEE